MPLTGATASSQTVTGTVIPPAADGNSPGRHPLIVYVVGGTLGAGLGHLTDGRAAVLTGHVLGSMIQSVLAVMAIFGLAFLIGFRS